ncbi:polysaccharide lyase family 8 super-sandwich domain-containing protein [Negadavirga shengliensis]|uniref:Polysaccharide lyase family 8 super-sandwich domain-containing protein n=1 Tax=Negadavirga shengliensis TaxID=1389218 RepID=A0ABV9SXF1_9BACT
MTSAYKTPVLILVCLFMFLSASAQQNDFATIKKKVVDELMKMDVEDEAVEEILGRMSKDGSFRDINYADLSRTAGFPHRRHTEDLVDLARAYKKEGSTYHQNGMLKERITASLKYWVDHDFFGDNWHNNQITTPTNLVHLMLLMGEELPGDLVQGAQPIIGRAHMEASGARPSGDRIVIAGILAKNLLFMEDHEGFDEVIKIIEGEIKFSTGERGMQHDYSFHHRHDRVNNTTSYGYGKYANAFGEWSYYVAGTKYAFSKEKIDQLADYYLDGVYKQLVYGIYEDISVKNRSISNKAGFQPKGTDEVEKMLFSTDYRRDELEEILKLRKGEISPTRSFSKFFWQTEHFVFQRPKFYTTVRMFSTRNRNMEEPYNGPGITTHHRADGTNYLMLKGDEYHDIWPVYDWQKISGTTILQKPKLHGPDNIQLDGLTDFVGAVTDGLYGAVAFDFKSPHDGVEAKKSWFFFDEEYVCLGTDIRSDAGLPVATTINQVLMRSDVTVMQQGEAKKIPHGRRGLDAVKYVYHDKVGYIFPEPVSIQLSNQEEKGRWSDITDQKNISEEVVREDVFMLWFDHGINPENASYQYIVVPNITEGELSGTSADNRGIEVLANNSEMQAVVNRKLGICQIAFYAPGELQMADGLRVALDRPGMAMLKMEGGRLKSMAVSDPSRKSDQLVLMVSGSYLSRREGIKTSPDPNNSGTQVVVELPQGVYAGKSVVVEFD